MSKKIKFKQI